MRPNEDSKQKFVTALEQILRSKPGQGFRYKGSVAHLFDHLKIGVRRGATCYFDHAARQEIASLYEGLSGKPFEQHDEGAARETIGDQKSEDAKTEKVETQSDEGAEQDQPESIVPIVPIIPWSELENDFDIEGIVNQGRHEGFCLPTHVAIDASQPGRYFAVRTHNESMAPEIPLGAVVIIDMDPAKELDAAGQTILFRLAHADSRVAFAGLRRLMIDVDGYTLKANNDKAKSINVTIEDVDAIEVLGIAIESQYAKRIFN